MPGGFYSWLSIVEVGGFHIFGIAPAKERGKYFRNNVWYLRPLWEFIGDTCSDILTQDELRAGQFNDGTAYSREKAERIAKRLKELLDSGFVADYEPEYRKTQEALPDEPCIICHGTGTRNDEVVKGTCNSCHGSGTMRPWSTSYPFATEHVEEFVSFLLASNGFEIW